jgi:glutaminyl-tRNA synthetase
MYDFTHCLADALECITHSICTLEFEDHRPLYDWFLDHLPVPARPRQYEFGRLNPSYTVTSKRKLKQLVDEKHVTGWDDPRMSTLSGYRRRGYTAASIRTFCDMIGVNRAAHLVRCDWWCCLDPETLTNRGWASPRAGRRAAATGPP